MGLFVEDLARKPGAMALGPVLTSRVPVRPCQAPSSLAPDATAPRVAGVFHRGAMRVRLLVFLPMQAHGGTLRQRNLRRHPATAQM